jgi:hypothetical protein
MKINLNLIIKTYLILISSFHFLSQNKMILFILIFNKSKIKRLIFNNQTMNLFLLKTKLILRSILLILSITKIYA